ncbi:aldehyde dehydrogenase family protein [Providencia burhodogranariea]|uniref:NAD-dependent aldehyde dehydrogenase n=1 Tax=Providencia burhodogranariea DSM 19968 TaxID=1141662 RepID=K8X3G3_9GAMM|nr:aldehyde dehydrogenase family protein [Providencia burhodogranariea]EKT62990.1 NAD-dependent aldehyde dehydrogenase [Providencia burhodogranariea DSM 19968]
MKEIIIKNPYTLDIVGSIATTPQITIDKFIDSALKFQSPLNRYQRAEIFKNVHLLLETDKNYAAKLITQETGISINDSYYEVSRVLNVLTLAIAELLTERNDILESDISPNIAERKVLTYRTPLKGIVYAITPFNHPINQVAHKIIPALATNNRVILKASEKTPLSAQYFCDLLFSAGLPREMLLSIYGDPISLYKYLSSQSAIELISFTGGVSVGKYIANRSGYRRLILELGGNDPLIIFADADLETAAELVVQGSYKNSGQRCTAIKRVLVHEDVADELTELVVDKTRSWRAGDPFDETIKMGTVIDENAARVIEYRIEEAIAQGARLRYGHQRSGALLQPTVLDKVTSTMSIVTEETFGPVTPILTFSKVDELINLVNNTKYGLSAGVCTYRMDLITTLAKQLHIGTLNVWEVPGFRTELSPFGGVKNSGLGIKEGIRESFKNYTNLQTLTLPW